MQRALSNPEKISEEMLGVCVSSRSARACGLDSFGSHRKCGRVDVGCTRGSDVESRREHRDCYHRTQVSSDADLFKIHFFFYLCKRRMIWNSPKLIYSDLSHLVKNPKQPNACGSDVSLCEITRVLRF